MEPCGLLFGWADGRFLQKGLSLRSERIAVDAGGEQLHVGLADAQRAKVVVACEEQHFQNGQARGPVDVADDALAPAVGAGIVDRAGAVFLTPVLKIFPCTMGMSSLSAKFHQSGV